MGEVHLRVEMACSGCSGAVERILGKMEGVDSYEVSLEQQKVTVRGEKLQEEAVIDAIAKSGKKTQRWTE